MSQKIQKSHFLIDPIQGKFERELKRKNGSKFEGSVIIKSEEILASRDYFTLQFVVSGLTGEFPSELSRKESMIF